MRAGYRRHDERLNYRNLVRGILEKVALIFEAVYHWGGHIHGMS